MIRWLWCWLTGQIYETCSFAELITDAVIDFWVAMTLVYLVGRHFL